MNSLNKTYINAVRLMYFLFSMSIYAQEDFGGLSAGGGLCDGIFRSGQWGCNDPASANNPGGSYPLLFDAFNTNPSTLPVFSSPFGLEAFYADDELNLSIIKGTNRLGLGLSHKETDMTFFSPVENYKVALKNDDDNYRESSLDSITTFGTALELLKFPGRFSFSFGLGVRYNQDKKDTTPVYGAALKFKTLSLGYSYYKETPDPYEDNFRRNTEENKVQNLGAGLKIGNFFFDYTVSSQQYSAETRWTIFGSTVTRSNYTVTTSILSALYKWGNLEIIVARRNQQNSRINETEQRLLRENGVVYKEQHTLAGLTYKSGRYSLGIHHNYVIDQDLAFLLQVLF